MTINNRRDAGYTIISRFEDAFRGFLVNKISIINPSFFELIPQGVILKANERASCSDWDDQEDFIQNIDFPDLKEITLFKQNYKFTIEDKLEKSDFIDAMDELYALRCKIAHIKGYFTSIDLDKLIEKTSLISKIFEDTSFEDFLNLIKTDPSMVVVKIPSDFVEDLLENNGIIHNLPTPDYDYEGGFVGREEDKKRIKQYLASDKFPVITITGAGGVGKTSLALKVIQEITQGHNVIFDSVLWLSAKENKLSPLGIEDIEPTLKSYEELLDTFIDLFGFTDDLISDSIESKQQLTDTIVDLSEKILVVIDNLETITDERIINFILDAPLKIKFLVTSRKGIGQVERRHELKELKDKEAVYLFRQLAKDKQLHKLSKLNDDLIKSYVSKVSFYPLAIKWVLGQVARGKDINRIIALIHTDESDISRFCFEQIFSSLSDNCKKVLFTVACMQTPPTKSILQHITQLDENTFEDTVEELILVSLLIPEQYQNEVKEIATNYTLLPLTKGYIRLQLSKNIELKESLNERIVEVESTVTESHRAQKEYKHSLHNFGAKTDEEKVATIISQNAFQKYQNGNYDSAVLEYQRAVKVAPKFAPVYRNWGVMESYENHLTEAIQLMEKASTLDKEDPQIYLLWGNIYRKNGKFNDANSKYAIAHSLSQSDPIILNAFGQSQSRLGNYEKAEELLKESLDNSKGFNSTKHEIITKTSLAENYINWADMLTRDKNYGKAKTTYDKAIQTCKVAISSNIRDSKVFTTLTKAYLKLAHLHFQMNRNFEATRCLNFVIKSRDESFKHSVYKLTALIDLAEHYLKTGKVLEIKPLLSTIKSEYKFKAILRNPKHRRLNDRLQYIMSSQDSRNKSDGVISTANEEYGYVIISTNYQGKTFIGGADDFIPRLANIDLSLVGLEVSFTEKIYQKDGKEKSQAKFIKIKVANNGYKK